MRRGSGFGGSRSGQLDDEARAGGVVILDANLRAVLGNDVVHDRETESRAPSLG